MKKAISVILLLTACTPLLAYSVVLAPFVSVKVLFFRILLSVVLVCLATLVLQSPPTRVALQQRLRSLVRNKTVLFSLLATVAILIGSLISQDPSFSFFGEVARGEGVLGLLFYLLFFMVTLVVFEKKEWLNFFKLSILVTWVLLVVEFFQAARGMERPESLIGNPNFLSLYLLFSIATSFCVYAFEQQGTFWRYTVWPTIAGSFIGILLTQSRGALLGLVVGGIVALCLSLFSKQVSKKMKHVAIGILSVGVIFSSVFLATRHNAVWAHIPSLGRIASFTPSDATTRARLTNASIALASISPQNEGIKKFIFGWGWEEYQFAWQKHYDPSLYQDDPSNFDRAHNMFLDRLAMGGILSFLLYIISLFFIARTFLSLRRTNVVAGIVLFGWFVAYLVQGYFGFDTVTTWIALYALVGFGVHMETIYAAE